MRSSDRNLIRREMRARRRALSPSERSAASRRFAAIAQRQLLLRPGRRVAVYFAYGHEADLAELIRRARRNRCRLLLPVITDYREHRMAFAQYEDGQQLHPNRYGIPEPSLEQAKLVPVRSIDVIFVPVVAVDARGWRIGSGAGFYDRCLHHLRAGRRWRRPHLVGVAYECQRLERIEPQRWDVPLAALITQNAYYRLRRTES